MSHLEILNIFVLSPGDTIYFLLLGGITILSLFMVLGLRQDERLKRVATQYMIGIIGAMIALITLTMGALYVIVQPDLAVALLPPLERATTVIMLLTIGWSMLTADHQTWRRAANIVVLLLLILIIVGYIFSGTQWPAQFDTQPQGFNLTNLGTTWAFVPLILSLMGALLTILLYREIVDSPLKLVYFIVLFMGFATTLYLTIQVDLVGNYAGPSRIATVTALSFMPLILFRIQGRRLRIAVQAVQNSAPQTLPKVPQPVVPPKTPFSGQSVRLLKLLGDVLDDADPLNLPEAIVMNAAEQIQADIGALLRLSDPNFADITNAYDRILGRDHIGVSALSLDDQPTLVNALERRAQRALYPDRNRIELEDLYSHLDVDSENIGPVYFQPLSHRDEVIAVLLLAMPYTRRELRADDLEWLRGVGILASSLLALSYEAMEAKMQAEDRTIEAIVMQGVAPDQVDAAAVISSRRELQQNLRAARDQIAELSKQNFGLKAQLDNERTRLANLLGNSEEGLSISQRIVTIVDEQDALRQDRDQLMRRLQEAEAALHGATAPDKEAIVNEMIEALNREKESLIAENRQIQRQLDELRDNSDPGGMTGVPSNVQHVVNRMVEEKARLEHERAQLQDKLSSIMGQLRQLGIEDDVTGLAQLIGDLYQERASLREQKEDLQSKLNILLRERNKLSASLEAEKQRDARIKALEDEMKRLAADREATIVQRDRLRAAYDELQDKLDTVKEHRARLLAQVSGFEVELNEAHTEQMRLRAQIQELADERTELSTYRDTLLAENEALRARGDDNGKPNPKGLENLRGMIADLTQERATVERELNRTRATLTEVEKKLADFEQASVERSVSRVSELPVRVPQNLDVLVGLAQELRTPMTSINGYVNLLLAEKPGILGEMQVEFLQRVGTNVSRLDTMIDTLVDVTEIDAGRYDLDLQPVQMVSLVEDAITAAAMQFRQKNLTVNMNIDEDLPKVLADEAAMTKIVRQLLENAYIVSPDESEIGVTVGLRQIRLREHDAPQMSLYFGIQDRGQGIHPDDIPRVFSRRYKAGNPLIEGVGDRGVGLSVARVLVERQGGRLWVESEVGKGSVFQFAIPVDVETDKSAN